MKLSTSILLIENDNDNRRFFIEALDEIENASLFNVSANVTIALEQLGSAAVLPDLIFTDIQMPGGIQLLTELINNPLTQNIPVVILSSSTSQSQLAFALGARAFIKKSFDNKALRIQLEEMINLYFMDTCETAAHTFQPLRSAA